MKIPLTPAPTRASPFLGLSPGGCGESRLGDPAAPCDQLHPSESFMVGRRGDRAGLRLLEPEAIGEAGAAA